MEKYNVGDIVRLKLLGDEHYYMVTDLADFTQVGDDKVDVDYEIVLIYPIEGNPMIETTIHDELEVVAEYNSENYKRLLDYIAKERVRLGYMMLPQSIRHIVFDENKTKDNISTKESSKRTVVKKVSKKKYGAKEINDILNDDTLDKKIDSYIKKMNDGLDLLNEAIEKDNKGQIEAVKKELEKVRQTLMELEYFPLTL